MIVRNFLKAHLWESVLLALCVAMAVAFTCALASLTGAYTARAALELDRAEWRTLTVEPGERGSRQEAAVVPAAPFTARPAFAALEGMDLSDLEAACPSVDRAWWEISQVLEVSPSGEDQPTPVPARVNARTVSPGFFDAFDLVAAEGSLFTADDYDQGRQVAVLGADLARRFFADGVSVGRSVLLDGDRYLVVGVLERDPLDGEPGGVNDRLYASPVTTRIITGPGGNVSITKRLPTLVAAVRSADDLAGATRELGSYLDRSLGEDAYTLVSSRDAFLAEQRKLARVLALVSILSALALLVAGVNILNLAGIRATRRARAVAVFRALGAGIPRVFRSLAAEVLTAALAGAAVGALAAFPLASLLSGVLLGRALRPDPVALAAALVASVLLAALFGTLPLYAAARRPPVDTLKAE